MILTKLQLKNFKSHLNTRINFNQGVSIIVGENGAGKSSILEAISFALFKQYSGNINNLIKIDKKNHANITMSVTLEFISDGNTYKVVRERNQTSSKASLYFQFQPRNNDSLNNNSKSNNSSSLNNNSKSNNSSSLNNNSDNSTTFTRLCTGDKQVNNEIQSILNMDADLFLNAIYIRQGEIADLVSKTSAEKKKLIGKLLGIESLEKAWKNSLDLMKEYELKKSELKGKISQNSKLKEDLDIKMKKLQELNSNGDKYLKELESIQKIKNDKFKEKTEIEIKKSKFENLNNNLNNETENVKQLKKDNETFNTQLLDLKKTEHEITILERKIEKLPAMLDFAEAVNNIKILKNEEQRLKEHLQNIENNKKILEYNELEHKEHIQLKEDIQQIKIELTQIENNLKHLKEGEKRQKELEEEINKDKLNIHNFTEKIKTYLSIDDDNFQAITDKIEKTKTNLNTGLKKFNEDISLKLQEVSSLKEKINSSKKSLSQLKIVDGKCPICNSDIDDDQKHKLSYDYLDIIDTSTGLIEKKEELIERLNQEKNKIESNTLKLQKIENEISAYKTINEGLKVKVQKFKVLSSQLTDNNEYHKKMDSLKKILKNKTERIEKTNKSFESFEKAKTALDFLKQPESVTIKLDEITEKIDNEVLKLKKVMDMDKTISTDIGENDLKNRIDKLKKADELYNQLKGSIQQKNILVSQIQAKEEIIKIKEEKIEKIHNELKLFEFSEEKYNKLSIEFKETEDRITELNKNISEIKGSAREIINLIDGLNKKISDNLDTENELNDINDYLDLLKEIRELYSKDKIQKDLRNKSRPLIQKHTVEFFEKFNFNYSDLQLDEDYNISVYGPDGETNLVMVSGGEKIAIALALRLGITQSLSEGNLETIMLDEPTIHLDSYRRSELIDILRKMSLLPQMIIVTHDSELENAADNIIKIEKDQGVSKVSS
ncbi:AAA family ATPase [Methanobrevibacter filiformis]|uniref:DNA double-strand break repair Rad50 ATPase n=1 Tax=Methanobrevibacter filiformis TaxID=55758 RepID=A0A166FB53_9EURY|nr:SMC family ATPase [Methanobrevibacter filiformis]KZX17489.1 putative DNA double-strand break repair Rad50 ATPase [Methanobrevibacter filiformis]